MQVEYFAYGSNMNPQRLADRNVVFTQRKKAVLPNYSLKFNKVDANSSFGFANVMPGAGFDKVEGVLYSITFDDLKKLDVFEGYPEKYDRKLYEVIVDKSIQKAWMYVAQRNETKNDLFPAAEYLQHLIIGSDILSPQYREFIHSFAR